MPPKDNKGKKTLEELHAYAELKHDPRASLSDSFTVCSTIMTADCQSFWWPTLFNILDKNRDQFLAPMLDPGPVNIESGLQIYLGFRQHYTQLLIGKTHSLFPNQWTKSCVAVNTTSGLLQIVVEGTLVLAEEFVETRV